MEEPILRIDHLTVRYGKTCDYCRNGGALQKNTCPHCKTVWAANDVSVSLYEGEILALHEFRLENKIITKTRACLIL